MSDELIRMSALELLAGYRAGRVSPLEATQAVLDRIHAVNDKINAFMIIDDEGALRAAKASEERGAKGGPEGRLDGVPVGRREEVLLGPGPGDADVEYIGPVDVAQARRAGSG